METPMFDQWRSRSPHYDESHEAVCDTVRAFVAKEITPHVDAWEAAGTIHFELLFGFESGIARSVRKG